MFILAMKKKFNVSLLESVDKEGKDWEVVLIEAGKSLNKRIYPKSTLIKAVPLFENCKAYAYEFANNTYNHLSDFVKRVIPEGFAKNLVGWYDNCRFGTFKDLEGKTQEGILAHFHVSEGAEWLRKTLKDAWENGKRNLLGFSIDGDGLLVPTDNKEFFVENITKIDSVDVVTNPAAGGSLRRLLASLNEEEMDMEFLKKLFEVAKKLKESLIEGIDSEKITPEQEMSLLKSLIESDVMKPTSEKMKEEVMPFMTAAIGRLIELLDGDKKEEALSLLKTLQTKMSSYGVPAQETKKTEPIKKTEPVTAAVDTKTIDELKKIKEDIEKMQKASQLANCHAVLNEALSKSDLFEPIKNKIRKTFEGKIFEQADLESALALEKETLARLSESGHVKGLGQTIDVQVDEADKIQASFDKMLGVEVDAKYKDVPAVRSIKEAYRMCHPEDANVTGNINSSKRRFARLTENIITSDFSYALSVSMTKRMGKDFKTEEFIFNPIVNEVGLDNFKQQENIKWGGFSTLPTVAERGTYGDLYEPSDQRATYTPGKKGGIVYVTRETIKNDDMKFIQQIPAKVTKASRQTLTRDIANLLITNPTFTVTNTTTFNTSHGNYSTLPLSYTNLTTRKKAMRAQKERGTKQDSGTVTSATSTVVTDSTKAWTGSAFVGYYARIVYGPGAGETRVITANDATTFTTAAWTATLTSSSKYEISAATNDDEAIGLIPKYLIHGDATEAMVDALLNSPYRPDSGEGEINVHKGKYTPIFCPYIVGSTYQYYWFLAADKAQTDMIEVGYIDDQRTPVLLVLDQPNLGKVFTNDEIQYKVRFEYGLATVENKGLDGNLATSV